jgi:hypothetical protein
VIAAETLAGSPVPVERVDHEDGSREYPYPPTGELLTSVTTITGNTEAKQHILVPWSGGLAVETTIDNLDTIVALLREGEQAEAGAIRRGEPAAEARKLRDAKRAEAIKLGKSAAERVRVRKRDAGKYVHKVAEALVLWQAPCGCGSAKCTHGSDLALPTLPGELAGTDYDGEPLEDVVAWMIDGFLNFVSDYGDRLAILASEMTVYSTRHGYAGTLDLIIRLDGYAISPADPNGKHTLIAAPGRSVTLVVDIKTGHEEKSWPAQLAAYGRAEEARMPMGDIVPMPTADAGATLHLRREFPRGWKLRLIAGREDAAAWNEFRHAAALYRIRAERCAKPGRVVYALRPDGTMPAPRIADLDGYGHAPSALTKAGVSDLEQLAAMTAGDCLKVKRVGKKVLDDIRRMLADNGLHLAGEAPPVTPETTKAA